jgi:hypothetical protein
VRRRPTTTPPAPPDAPQNTPLNRPLLRSPREPKEGKRDTGFGRLRRLRPPTCATNRDTLRGSAQRRLRSSHSARSLRLRLADQVETRVDAGHVGGEVVAGEVVAGDRVSSDVVLSQQAGRVEARRQSVLRIRSDPQPGRVACRAPRRLRTLRGVPHERSAGALVEAVDVREVAAGGLVDDVFAGACGAAAVGGADAAGCRWPASYRRPALACDGR